MTNYNNEIELFFNTLEELAGRTCPEKEKVLWDQILKTEKIPKKNKLIQVGEVPTKFYYIVKGLTRQFYIDEKGNEVTRGFSYEGEFVCTEVLIQGSSAVFNIEALEDCRMLAFNLSELDVLRNSSFMKDVYIGALEKNVAKRLNRDAMFLMNDATGRYEAFVEKHPGLLNRVKKIYLASYLGMTPECLSRVRKPIKERN